MKWLVSVHLNEWHVESGRKGNKVKVNNRVVVSQRHIIEALKVIWMFIWTSKMKPTYLRSLIVALTVIWIMETGTNVAPHMNRSQIFIYKFYFFFFLLFFPVIYWWKSLTVLNLCVAVLGCGHSDASWQQGTGPESRGIRLCCSKPVHRHHQHLPLHSRHHWQSQRRLSKGSDNQNCFLFKHRSEFW